MFRFYAGTSILELIPLAMRETVAGIDDAGRGQRPRSASGSSWLADYRLTYFSTAESGVDAGSAELSASPWESAWGLQMA